MKGFFKFFFTSSALLVLTGFTFLYFGWIDFNHPFPCKGVVHFKTSGYSKTLLSPQTWYWNWQYIIPKNTTIYVVDLSQKKENLILSGELPSAKALSSLVEDREDFKYTMKLDYIYSLDEKCLVELYKKQILTDSDDLTPISKDLKQALSNSMNTHLTQIFENIDEFNSLDTFKSKLEKELLKMVNSQFPFLKEFQVNLHIENFPQLELYKKTSARLLDILEEKAQAKKEEEIKITRDTSEEQSRLEWLTRYGELLKKYPELKELLLSDNLRLFSFFSGPK